MFFKTKSNPIGKIHSDQNLENFVITMSNVWDKQREIVPWYRPFKKIQLTKVTNFLIHVLDDVVAYVDHLEIGGPDKKATVLRVIELLYDHVIKEAMPFWLKPFANQIKQRIILELVATALDWIVEKYRNGEWRKKDPEILAAQWTQGAS